MGPVRLTRPEKKAALMQSIWATYLLVPLLWLVLAALKTLGYELDLGRESLYMGSALVAAAAANYCLARDWLVDQLFYYLYSAALSLIVAAAIYQTGNMVSPFVWIGLIIVIYDVIAYSPVKGISEALFFVAVIWVAALAELQKLIPGHPLLPELQTVANFKYVMLMLISNTLLFGVITYAVVYISERLRRERIKALLSAQENARAYRATVSVMEDLESAHGQLKDQIKELDQSRRETLRLLHDVQQAKAAADQQSAETAKLYEQLKSVDKMKTEFLSLISHELRTPITPILGYSSVFLGEQYGSLPPEYKKGAAIIKKESEHLMAIINSIIDVARLERGISLELTKEPVSLSRILAELVAAMMPQFEERQLKVGIDLPPDFPTVMADADKLRRLLTNLLGNALNFTPKGGSVVVRGAQKGDHLELSVSDSGIGIARENLEKIFGKFYQVDSSYTRQVGGVGLGLAIAKEIVEAHGGKIWAESEGLGHGTTIKIILPIGV
ncbi:MAG: HAMP domain-containing histidine kinase [Candidatus Saganbacteria bacterium]|nr:HAMP domain-containing histidine kinase [Candidatus Saganbacteria bacterium]